MDLIRYLRAQWDRAAGAAAMVAGGIAIAAGWAGVSRALLPAAQLPYVISGGIGGLYLLGVGATLWLSADLRDEWRHLDSLEERVTQRVLEQLRHDAATTSFIEPVSNGRRPLVAGHQGPR